MKLVKEYAFYNIKIEDVDEKIFKACSDCSYRYIHSYSLRLIFNIKIIDVEDSKTKNKVFKFKSIGLILFLFRRRKKGYKVIKLNTLTLQFYGNIDYLNICYHLKLVLQLSPLKKAFYKNIATNDDYINNFCVPSQTEFTDNCVKW